MAKKSRAGVSMPMWIACILLLLVLLTVYLSKDIYARYGSGDRSGMHARVAGFGSLTLTEEGDFAPGRPAMILPGANLTKRATVDFEGGEVSSFVFVELVLSPQWSTTNQRTFAAKSGEKTLLSFTVASDWQYLTKTSSGTYVFYQALDANEELHAEILANDGRITVGTSILSTEMDALANAFINLRATAVQSNGFASVNEAWTSVAG